MNVTPIQRPGDAPLPAPRTLGLPFDPLLLAAAVGLLVCSLVTVAGATRNEIPGDPNHYLDRQAIYGVIGLVLMFALSRLDYSRLRELKLGLYGLMLATILLVLGLGGLTRGSRRWISLPFFQFQPSELGKLLLIASLAAFIVDRARWLGDRQTSARIMLLALLPALFVIAQPDLGTGLVFVTIAVAMLFIAGTPWRHFAAFAVVAGLAVVLVLVVAPALGVHLLKPYQVDRLTAFLHPSDDPSSAGYQQNQSLIAIGSGGKTGRGLEQATQTTLNYLPEQSTDFIFSSLGERFGFAGSALALSLYALLIWRALRILTVAKNLYGSLIAGGIVAMLMFQVFVNVGMTLGIMPITGVPLPLLSFGGSSMLVTFLAIGLLQSIYVQARDIEARKGRALLSQ